MYIGGLGRDDCRAWGRMTGTLWERRPTIPGPVERVALRLLTGVRRCKLETACRDQIPYLWLTGWQRPDHNTLWRFYKNHRQAMRNLFKHTVRTAFRMELVDLAVQAVDLRTKVRANAANDRTYDDESPATSVETVGTNGAA